MTVLPRRDRFGRSHDSRDGYAPWRVPRGDTDSERIDRSYIYAVLDAADAHNAEAAEQITSLLESDRPLRTHSYVLVELAALVQARLGMRAASTLLNHWTPLLDVRRVDASLHDRGVSALLASERREVSLVDWISFEMMREQHLTRAFTFDTHFRERGYEIGSR